MTDTRTALWNAFHSAITEPFEGTPSELLMELSLSGVVGLPKTPQAFSAAMPEVYAGLVQSGWRISRRSRGSYRLWSITPPGHNAPEAPEMAAQFNNQEPPPWAVD